MLSTVVDFLGMRFVADTASNAERANPAWTSYEGVSTTAAPTGVPCRLRRHRLAGWPRMARPRAGEPSRRLGKKDGFDPGENDPPFRHCPFVAPLRHAD